MRKRYAAVFRSLMKLVETFQIVEEWRFIALILDRLFLIIFVSISLIGTMGSLLQAPSLYISTPPVDPMCYLYYPPINDSHWMKKCGPDYPGDAPHHQLSLSSYLQNSD